MKKPPLVDPDLAPSERLVEYMKIHRELTFQKNQVKKKMAPLMKEASEIRSKLSRVGTAINHLKHGGNTPLVTDHAIVRYLERVEKVNIDDIRLKIYKHRDSVKQGNVIVTVNEVPNENPS